MTAGEYLKAVFAKKNVQLSELAAKMGLKSRNTLYRLLEDKCSKEKASELVKKIAVCIGLSDKEIDGFYDRLNHNGENVFFTRTRTVLMNLYAERIPDGYSFEYNGETKRLADIFACCKDEQTDVIISGIEDMRIIGDICAFAEQHPNVRLHHYVRLRPRSVLTAYEITALTIFMNYRNYNPYIAEEWSFKGICILEKDGTGCFVHKLEFLKNNVFFLESRLPSEMYDHIQLKLKEINRQNKPIKKQGKKVADYIEILKDSMVLDDGKIFYSEGAPCFGTLTFEIAYELFEEADFFGFPEEHPYVKGIVELYKKRQNTFLNTDGAKRYYMLDESHMKTMIETGISFDHPERFPPLSKEQLRRYFKWLIEMSESHPEKIELRCAKVREIKYPFVYGIDKMYYMYHSDSGYMDGFVVTIDEPGIFEIMNDFVNYIWEILPIGGGTLITKYLQAYCACE